MSRVGGMKEFFKFLHLKLDELSWCWTMTLLLRETRFSDTIWLYMKHDILTFMIDISLVNHVRHRFHRLKESVLLAGTGSCEDDGDGTWRWVDISSAMQGSVLLQL